MKRSTLRRLTTLFIALLCLGVCAVLSGAVKRAATKASARALFCAYGGIGLRPVPTPPGFESEFAVAVVEINSPSKTMNVSVTDFVLLDRDGRVLPQLRQKQWHSPVERDIARRENPATSARRARRSAERSGTLQAHSREIHDRRTRKWFLADVMDIRFKAWLSAR